MRKYRLCVIKKYGTHHRHISIRFCRDTITGEYSVFLSGFGCMLMICVEKVIPEIINLANSSGRFPRQLPWEILVRKDFYQK